MTRIEEIRQKIENCRAEDRLDLTPEADAMEWLLKQWDIRDTALRDLVEQWRAKVDQIVYDDGKHVSQRCEGYVNCADDLAAALARLLEPEA